MFRRRLLNVFQGQSFQRIMFLDRLRNGRARRRRCIATAFTREERLSEGHVRAVMRVLARSSFTRDLTRVRVNNDCSAGVNLSSFYASCSSVFAYFRRAGRSNLNLSERFSCLVRRSNSLINCSRMAFTFTSNSDRKALFISRRFTIGNSL